MGQREPGIIPAAEWGEKPRETVTVKPAASRISQIRKALLPGRCQYRGQSCYTNASPGCFWRPGDFLLPGTMVPHAFYRKHDSYSKPPGRGRTADLSRPAFQKNFCAICRSFHVPETRAVL